MYLKICDYALQTTALCQLHSAYAFVFDKGIWCKNRKSSRHYNDYKNKRSFTFMCQPRSNAPKCAVKCYKYTEIDD